MEKNDSRKLNCFCVALAMFLFGIQTGFCADPEVFDGFHRPDSNAAGETELGNYQWVEVGDNINGDLIGISNGKLYFHYFVSQPYQPVKGCNLGEYKKTNVEIAAKAKPAGKYGYSYGISYRLENQEGDFRSNGYHVKLNTKNETNTVSILYGNQLLKTKEISLPNATKDGVAIKITAKGPLHRVYLNNILELELCDYNKITEGYVGLFSYYTVVAFSEFESTELEPDVFDGFNRANSNTVGTAEIGNYTWLEGEGDAGSNVSIVNNRLVFHYFTDELCGFNFCNLEGYTRADVEISVDALPANGYGGGYGVSYRMGSELGAWHNSAGYRVYLDTLHVPNTISLYYANTLIARNEITIPDPAANSVNIKVIANGPFHKIYLNDQLSLDVVDDTKISAGYIGLWSWFTVVAFDDFKASAITDDIYDDFKRNDSNKAGVTPKGSYQWLEAGENVNNNLIVIKNNALIFHYFASTPNSPALSCNIDNFQVADTEISVAAMPHSGGYGYWYGVSYRMDKQDGRFNSPGYHVRLETQGATRKVSLYYGNALISSKDVSIPDPSQEGVAIKVIAIGPSHKIYLNGQLELDINDYTKINQGYVGLSSWYTVVAFRDFKINLIAHDLYDDFSRINNKDTGVLSKSNLRWVEAGDLNGGFISIANNYLKFHYFANPGGNTSPRLSCNVGQYQKQDFEMSVTATPHTGYGYAYGLSYRMDQPNGTLFAKSPGYYVRLDTSNNKISLYYGSDLLADRDILPIDNLHQRGVEIKAVVNGPAHKIYLNGNLSLEVTDYNKIAKGYVGLHSYFTIVYFRDFKLKEMATDVNYNIYDGFKRNNSLETGNTELGNYPWLEAGENANNNLIVIKNNALIFHYFASAPNSPALSCNIKNFQTADTEIGVDAMTHISGNYGYWYGISYRMDKQDGRINSPGYHVRLETRGDTRKVSLYYGNALISSKDVSIPDPSQEGVAIKVVAIGPSHKIYLNGQLELDINDYTKINQGYVGLSSWYTIVAFKDMFVKGAEKLYPQGRLFPLGLYSVSPEDMMLVKKCGFNYVHTYTIEEEGTDNLARIIEWMDNARDNNLFALMGASSVGRLTTGTVFDPVNNPEHRAAMDEFIRRFDVLKEYDNLAYWYHPEEQRYWVGREYGMLQMFGNYIRTHDPQGRPMHEYQGGHYDGEGLSYHVPYAKCAYAGCYVNYSQQPRAWVYWRMAEERRAINIKNMEIYDGFSRGDSLSIGKTLVGVKSWTKVLDLNPDPYGIKIKNRGLYFEKQGAFACNLWNYQHGENIEISVAVNTDDLTSSAFGIQYRLNVFSGIAISTNKRANGYSVQFDKKNSVITLNRTDSAGIHLLDSYNTIIPDGWFDVRVKADGAAHAVYVNNQLIISITDDSLPLSGYVGLFVSNDDNDIVIMDTFSVKNLATPELYQDNEIVAMLQLTDNIGGVPPTSYDAYHDFYASIVGGARNVLIFSYYWGARMKDNNNKVFEAYAKGAKEVSSILGDVILFGKDVEIVKDVVSGPSMAEEFLPIFWTRTVQYPSVNFLAKEFNDNIYIIAVNSSASTANCRFTASGVDAQKVLLPFEGRSIKFIRNQFEDEFQPLAVHIYLLQKPAQP